ncbi:hypothetical protein Lepto7376_0216 [[Leptolyngbya] sp. PCC 7376]|uniref:hypothetical protein n=1 Tax=[Leptolyngbya] sp. PCC 7376 TaxID=111781 RepID=UPI00029EEAD7|nr:hypothetical protein [[Leptolyngbya] sp. PCC 7376]AFY36661.1 hypothetical protein Lepto7376_0216 [[Leptolyngbya] sp. PCC 7376]
MSESANNLDQIRDLLFGQQLGTYEDQFQGYQDRLERIETSLGDFRGQMKLQLKELEGMISSELVGLNKGLDNKLKHFSTASNSELTKLEKMLNDDMYSFFQELNSFERDFGQKQSSIQDELRDIRQHLTAQLSDLKDAISSEWNNLYGETNDGKLTKDQLGKMLFEFSLKTRDGSFLAELPESMQEQMEAELES